MKDRLYNWKKHSGFRTGLATDIVMGNRNSDGNLVSTMNSDYHVVEQKDTQKPAGKPIGFDTTDKSRNHIIFGDIKMARDDRQKSITESVFTAPVIEKEVTIRDDTSIVSKFHSKPITATSAAHIGLQTRQDLPIDDAYFHSFDTTTQDSYKNRNLDLKVPSQYSNNGRPSHILLGDLEKQRSYQTVHETSFLQHPEIYYHKSNSKPPRHVPIALGHKERRDPLLHYETTSSSSFQPKELLKTKEHDGKNNQSSISFGEEQSDRRKTGLSVTRRDYNQHESYQKCCNIVQKNSGIFKAIKPTSMAMSDFESQNSASFKSIALDEGKKIRVAGLPNTKGSVNWNQLKFGSSVPTGDPKHFYVDSFKTTSSENFHPYPYVVSKHPVLGAQMTVSNITFGEPSQAPSIEEHYSTTTGREFTAYTRQQMNQVRGKLIEPQGAIYKDSQSQCETVAVSTTHQHFNHQDQPRQRKPILPQVANKHKLFPIRNDSKTFKTTNECYYADRNELYQIAENILAKGQESSLVFGDPKYKYFNRDQNAF